MAIAFDAASGAKDNSGSNTSLTWAHTCTGTDLTLYVFASIYALAGQTVTGVTYNGVAMTALGANAAGASMTMRGFYLINPATGANNVVVTFSAVASAGNQQTAAQALSYTGTNQSAQPDSYASNVSDGSTTTSYTIPTTVVGSNCWLVGAATEDAGDIAAGAAGSGTTYRNVAQFNQRVADSNGTVSTGSQSLIYGRAGASGNLVGMTVSISPAATTNIKTFNGVTYANTKTVDGVVIASVKTFNGIS